MKIEIRAEKLETDPPLTIYHLEVINETGSWRETFGDPVEVVTFMKGLACGCMMVGDLYLHIPNVPQAGETSVAEIKRRLET